MAHQLWRFDTLLHCLLLKQDYYMYIYLLTIFILGDCQYVSIFVPVHGSTQSDWTVHMYTGMKRTGYDISESLAKHGSSG